MSNPLEWLDNISYDSEYYPGSKQKRPAATTTVQREVEPEDWTQSESYTKTVQGVPVEFFTIGALCMGLERPAVTLRLWIRKGYIPDATFRMPTRMVNGQPRKGRRLYTKAQVEAVLRVCQEHGIRRNGRVDWSKHHPQVALEIHEAWAEIKRQQAPESPAS